MRRVTSWLHVWSGSGRRVNPCWMVPSVGTRYVSSCHDVTGKVQGARAVNCRAGARAASYHAGAAHLKKKMQNKSKPRFRVNRIPWAGVKDPLYWAQDTSS